MKKIIALILATAMLVCCLAGCGANKTEDDTVMTVNGVKVSWDEYMFWIGYAAMYLNYQYSMYGMTVDWTADNGGGQTNAQWCVDYAKETVIQKCLIEAKCAELGITLSDDDNAEIQKSIDDFKVQSCGEGATDEQFEAYLKSNQNSSIAVLRSSQEATTLTNKLFTELYGEDGSKADASELLAAAEEAGYTKCNHILFLFTDENHEERSDADKAAGLAKLEGIRDELNAIENTDERYARFLELKEENCEDTGTEAYQFGEGVMVEEFYEMSRSLGEYEMDIVESSYGYHLIIGLPLDLDYSVTSQSSTPISLRETMLNEQFSDQLSAWEKEAEVVMAEQFKDFDFSTLFGTNGFIYQSWADRTAAKEKK